MKGLSKLDKQALHMNKTLYAPDLGTHY